jgi:hypothetical protein
LTFRWIRPAALPSESCLVISFIDPRIAALTIFWNVDDNSSDHSTDGCRMKQNKGSPAHFDHKMVSEKLVDRSQWRIAMQNTSCLARPDSESRLFSSESATTKTTAPLCPSQKLRVIRRANRLPRALHTDPSRASIAASDATISRAGASEPTKCDEVRRCAVQCLQ